MDAPVQAVGGKVAERTTLDSRPGQAAAWGQEAKVCG